MSAKHLLRRISLHGVVHVGVVRAEPSQEHASIMPLLDDHDDDHPDGASFSLLQSDRAHTVVSDMAGVTRRSGAGG